jgi:chromosome partitioning protein
MNIMVTNFEGGSTKTTTAVHIASYLQNLGPTLLIDGDPNGSATAWAARGHLPFRVLNESQGAYQTYDFEHIVIDTWTLLATKEMERLAKACHLIIVPTVVGPMDMQATTFKTIEAIQRFASGKHKILISRAPPSPQRNAQILRAQLITAGIPVFDSDIPNLKAFQDAAKAGLCVSDLKGVYAQRAWQAYEAVGSEIYTRSSHRSTRLASRH